MPEVKVVGKYHFRKENGKKVRYKVGETFDATDREVKSFKGRLKVLDTPTAKEKAKPGPKAGAKQGAKQGDGGNSGENQGNEKDGEKDS